MFVYTIVISVLFWGALLLLGIVWLIERRKDSTSSDDEKEKH